MNLLTKNELETLKEPIQKLNQLAKIPIKTETEMKMVEIIMLKYKDPEVENKCVNLIIENTSWPFKLVIYDNRLNTANTSRIWNKLIKDSTCDYILIIDSDAFITPSNPCWLTKLMETFEKIPNCEIVLPVSNNVGGSGQKMLREEKYPQKPIRSSGPFSGFCFLFKKSVIEKIGWHDEDFYIYGGDSEWAFRALKKGIGCYIRPDVFVEHLGGYSFKKAHQKKEVDREVDKIRARLLYRMKTK